MRNAKKWLFLISFQLPIQTLIGYWIGFNFLSPLILFLGIPILDTLLGEDRYTPQKEQIPLLEKDPYYPVIPLLWVLFQVSIFIWGAYVVTYIELPFYELVGFIMSIGLLTGAGGITVAHELGQRRLEKKGFPVIGVHNQIIWFVAIPALIATGLGLGFGAMAVAFYFIQSFIGITLLEAINYIEHYGLQRKMGGDGRYERVGAQHSWNSNQILTNIYLLQLPRHSDHHLSASRRYQSVSHVENSPMLPWGYSEMLFFAFVPPLWFKVMNPRVKRIEGNL